MFRYKLHNNNATMVTVCLFIACGINLFITTTSFVIQSPPSPSFGIGRTRLCADNNNYNDKNRFQRQIDERGMANAQGGMGETAAGVVLGGLLLGPFGALFGAQLGASVGAKNAVDRARKEEMAKLGITQDMLNMAQEVGISLERAVEGLSLTQENLSTLQSLAKKLDEEATSLYEKATIAIKDGDEETARNLLLKRSNSQDKLKSILLQCADAKKRIETMEENVQVLDVRAKEVEALLSRTVTAKTTADLTLKNGDISGSSITSLSDEDPLLRKFKDMGIN